MTDLGVTFPAEMLEQHLNMAQVVVDRLLTDMDDAHWLLRPHPKCNPINWQVGHLVLSEHQQMAKIAPGSMPALPAGFADAYRKPTGKPETLPHCESTRHLVPKDVLCNEMHRQRTATVEQLHRFSTQQLQQDSGISYAPKVYSVFLMIATHWTMHSGQWTIVRREVGLPIAM
ncbi:MAG: DinB family protein [Aureliella sp.]